MSVTIAAALFETNFIVLPSFSLCHMKARLYLNPQRGIRTEIVVMWGSGGVAPSRRRHRGSGPSSRRLLWFFNKNYV